MRVAPAPQALPTAVTQAGVPSVFGVAMDVRAFDTRAFVVDDSCKVGIVAMVYMEDDGAPSFWFMDRSRAWHLLASSFTEYLRLTLAHYGIPLWHYAFTPCGLDPRT